MPGICGEAQTLSPVFKSRHIDAAKQVDITNIIMRGVASSRETSLSLNTASYLCNRKTTTSWVPTTNFDFVLLHLLLGTNRNLRNNREFVSETGFESKVYCDWVRA